MRAPEHPAANNLVDPSLATTIALLPAGVRPLLADRLPDWLEPRWFATDEHLLAHAPEAEIGWIDIFQFACSSDALRAANRLRWVNTMVSGVETMPQELLRERGIILTNGSGLHATTIAEYAVMGMLVIAKGYRSVVHAQGQRNWLTEAPGRAEISGSKVLILGAGAIGGQLAHLLSTFGCEITTVGRTPRPGVLGAGDWRARLGALDWAIITAASARANTHMIGRAELAAMKRGATLMNFSRGTLADTDALLEMLQGGHLGAAFLDVTDPEPLPADHPLWNLDNVHISMHLSGRSQETGLARAAQRFLENLERFRRGDELIGRVDLELGY